LGIVVFAIDLQQALLNPFLSPGSAFYKLNTWTCNFNVYSGVSDQRYMFTLNEDREYRGNDEISRCILKLLEMLPRDCKV
jgi:hypothetical protein